MSARLDIGTDLPEKHPDKAHRQAVQHASGRHEADADEPKENQRAVFHRAEQQRDIAQGRSEPRQHDDRDCAADKARHGGCEQRDTRLSLQRHLITVDAGDDTGCMRDLHGDGADVVAVLRAIINACEHDERACRWDPERQRQ